MAARIFSGSLQFIAKRLVVMLVGSLILLGLAQPVLAAPAGSQLAANLQLALAGSSRFAAQAEAGPQESAISEDKLNEMREKRREWQSEASGEAAQEAEQEANSSFGEALKDKLNLEEISEENEIIENIKD